MGLLSIMVSLNSLTQLFLFLKTFEKYQYAMMLSRERIIIRLQIQKNI